MQVELVYELGHDQYSFKHLLFGGEIDVFSTRTFWGPKNFHKKRIIIS